MDTPPLLLFLFLFLSLSSISPATAAIKTVTLVSDDRPLILLDDFSFADSGGAVSITVNSLSLANSSSSSSHLCFLLLASSDMHSLLNNTNPNTCLLSRAISLPSPREHFSIGLGVVRAGKYFLFFANSAGLEGLDSRVSATFHVNFYSIRRDGSPDYLPSWRSTSPGLYAVLSFASAGRALFIAYAFAMLYKNHAAVRSRPTLFLMLALLAAKTVNLVTLAMHLGHVQHTGVPRAWQTFAVHSSRLVIQALVFLAILLPCGPGVTALVLLLRVVAAVAGAVVDTTGPYMKQWALWNYAFTVPDVASCVVSVLAVAWSVRSRRRSNRGEGSLVARSTATWWFLAMVVVYMWCTRFMAPRLVAHVGEWAGLVLEESVDVVFYVCVMHHLVRAKEMEGFWLDDGVEESTTV